MTIFPYNGFWKDWEHLKCSCGGILGMYDRGVSSYCTCDQCGNEIYLYRIQYDVLMINDKTGWVFPMIRTKNLHS